MKQNSKTGQLSQSDPPSCEVCDHVIISALQGPSKADTLKCRSQDEVHLMSGYLMVGSKAMQLYLGQQMLWLVGQSMYKST